MPQPTDCQETAGGRVRLTTLDQWLWALLLAPLAAPFVLVPLGFVVWGVARLAEDYAAAVRAPARPAPWWDWPWGWPGAKATEALHVAFGGPPLSDLSPFGPWPWHLADWFEVAGRALTALCLDGLVALLPLILASWAVAVVMAAVRGCRAKHRFARGGGDTGHRTLVPDSGDDDGK